VTGRPDPRRALAPLAVALVVLASCGGDDDTAGPTSSGGNDTTPTTDTTDTTTDTTVTPDVTTTAPPVASTTTLAQVTTTVIGTAVGGSSGGIGPGETNTFSEAVRNADGSCSGWDGPGGQWTAGLESGAAVRFLDDDGNQIGSGQVGTSAFQDVDPDGGGQWNCLFPFDGEVIGAPTSLRIQVADLPPWRARPDPADPSRWVVSVDTSVQVDAIPQCSEPSPNDFVQTPFAVGLFWSEGLANVCGAGFTIADVERPCRPPQAASERVLSVVLAADPATVVEDASGPVADPSQLVVGTPVIVRVATGRPCG
jgi:hypothetical protein